MEKLSLKHNETELFVSKRMIVKIGSSSITRDGDPLNRVFMGTVAEQVSKLFMAGVEVAVVSSGSVTSGRSILSETYNDIVRDQVAAIYGQNFLMDAWNESFKKHRIHVGQVLFSEDDLTKPNTPIVMGLRYGIQIINANDAVNDSEMKAFFLSADNDKLAGHVANFINADTLLLLTDINGVLDSEGNVIKELFQNQEVNLLGKSSVGTGGMLSKVNVGFEASKQGIRTIIANAYENDAILKVARGEKIGTSFVND